MNAAPLPDTMNTETMIARRIATSAAVLGAVSAVTLGVLRDPLAGLSSLIGTGVLLANLWAFSRLITRMLDPRDTVSKPAAGVLLVAKVGVLFALVGVLLSRPWMNGLGFLSGVTTVVLSIAIGGLWTPPNADTSKESS